MSEAKWPDLERHKRSLDEVNKLLDSMLYVEELLTNRLNDLEQRINELEKVKA